MGIRQVVVDDFSGEELSDDVQPLHLTVGDKGWNLYLSDKSKDSLYKALEKYTKTANEVRPTLRSIPSSASRAAGASSVDLNAIRIWARENGYEVADRGRIKQDIVDAYNAANPAAEASED